MTDGLPVVIAAFFRLFDTEILALFVTLPRIYAFLAASTLFAPTAVPRAARTGLILLLAAFAAPANVGSVEAIRGNDAAYAALFVKEFAIGFLLGHAVGWVFWSVQAVGSLIDNQRGAAIASAMDPLQGQEASPIGLLLSQGFITYVFATGAIYPIIGILLQSYAVWPAGSLSPIGGPDLPVAALGLLDAAMRFVLLLAGPAVAVMFLAEFAIAMVSRFSPQIQVFVLAMPIKSILGLFVLFLGLTVLMSTSETTLYGTFEWVNRFAAAISPPDTPPEPMLPILPVPGGGRP